jgi:hypothetical protein
MTAHDYDAILHLPELKTFRRKIAQIFVRHPKAEETREMLRLSLGSADGDLRNPSVYIIGYSRCGKSEIVKRLIYEETGKRITKDKVQLLEGRGKRFIYVDLMGGATPRTLARTLNGVIFNDRDSLKLGEDEGTDALIQNINTHNIGGVFLDEAGNMADDKQGVRKLGRFILSFENQSKGPLILIGDSSLANLRSNVRAAKQRSGGIKILRPFGFESDEYAAFVAAFSQALPFKRNWFTLNEGDHHMLRATFFAQRGRPGRHSLLLDAAAIHAFVRTGGTEPQALEKEDVAAAFARLSLDDSEMFGLNPFLDEDYRRLPKFPLNVEQEENPV